MIEIDKTVHKKKWDFTVLIKVIFNSPSFFDFSKSKDIKINFFLLKPKSFIGKKYHIIKAGININKFCNIKVNDIKIIKIIYSIPTNKYLDFISPSFTAIVFLPPFLSLSRSLILFTNIIRLAARPGMTEITKFININSSFYNMVWQKLKYFHM